MIILRPALAEDVMVILSMRKEFYSIDQYPFDEEEQARMTTDFIQMCIRDRFSSV